MKGKPIYSFFWICLAVVLVVQLSGVKVFAQEIYPQVLESDPESMQTDVPVSSAITILFTVPMDPVTTAEAFHFYIEGTDEVFNNLKDSGYLDIENATLTFTPLHDLEPGTTYWIKIKSTATDMNQPRNSLDGNNNGVGEEGEDDDWKIMFTTAAIEVPPPAQDHWSQVYGPGQGIDGKICCMAVDSRDNLWAATNDEDGIYYFDGNAWQNKTSSLDDSQMIDNFLCMAADGQDRLWVALDTSRETSLDAPRLARWENNTWQEFSAANLSLLEDEVILKIAFDSSDNVWMITSGSKVINYNNSNRQVITYAKNDLSEGALVIDREDNVWVGSAVNGAFKLPKGKDTWEVYSYNDAPGPYSTKGMGIDPAGHIWIGTTIGLLKLDPSIGKPGVWTRYTTSNTGAGLPSNDITSLAVDPKSGAIWAGTSSGLGKFDGKTQWTNFAVTNISELSDQKINTLALNPRGEVWLGTDDGLMKRDDIRPYIVVEESSPTNETLVDQTVKIRIVFSEPMRQDAATNAFTLMNAVKATTVAGEFSWTDERTLEFTPEKGVLDADQTYRIIMATSVLPKDLAGNSLSTTGYEVTFSTQGNQQSNTRFSPAYDDDVNLSGSGCFIDSVSHKPWSWLRRVVELLWS
ncbi:MAG: Ig-like domain-containing protein [bacterium]